MADNLGKWCTPKEIALLHSIVDNVPDADTVTHNDLHPGSIVLQAGELVLIDMPEVTMGPPICDLVTIFLDLILGAVNEKSLQRVDAIMEHLLRGVVIPSEQAIRRIFKE